MNWALQAGHFRALFMFKSEDAGLLRDTKKKLKRKQENSERNLLEEDELQVNEEFYAVIFRLISGRASQGLGWETVHEIIGRAVAKGKERRKLEGLKHLGMDENSFKRGQSYISLLNDLDHSRVVDVVEGRTNEAAQKLWESLSAQQKLEVEAVAMDMWEPFIRTTQKQMPLKNPEHQVCRPRVPQLQKLPDSHPVLLRKAFTLPIMNREESKIS
jgi:hypothetical protein